MPTGAGGWDAGAAGAGGANDDVTLYLVRHADAVDAEAARGGDETRALTARGNAQARLVASSLTLLRARLQRVLTSPKLRAVQTAEALRAHGGPGATAPLETLEELARGDAMATVRAVAAARGPAETRLALVGHEPHLSALADYLLTGDVGGARARVQMRKAAVATLSGTLRAGGMTLLALVPVQHVQALAGTGPVAPDTDPARSGGGRH